MNANIEIFYFINHNLQNPLFDFIMPIFCDVGGFVPLLCICIAVLVLARYFKKDKYFEIAKFCLAALVLSGVIVGCLKLAFHSPRPFTVLSNVRQLVIPTEPNSFPSGHTSSTLSIITVLVWYFRRNWLLVGLLVLIGFFVGFSRVYAGVHYPFDVAVGAAVGVLSGVVVLGVKKRLKV